MRNNTYNSSSEFNFKAYLAEKNHAVNQELNRMLPADTAPAQLLDAMRHSLFAGGKRLRPVLCIAASEAIGHSGINALRAGCAIELIHTYSLVHDDLPAMDNDDMRRGEPTCHVAFNEATAILAGDALLATAFEVLANTALKNRKDSQRWLKVIANIACAAGYKGMVEGQMRDILAENVELSPHSLEKMHMLKTGEIIKASVTTGAILNGASSQQLTQLESYAQNIGLAFQVTDDILNVIGKSHLMGKTAGSDEAHQKSTYPSVIGLDASMELAITLADKALLSLEAFDKKSEPLRAIGRYIIKRNR